MYPLWYPVNCNEGVRTHVVCINSSADQRKHSAHLESLKRHSQCVSGHILHRKNCYRFSNSAFTHHSKLLDHNEIQDLKVICIYLSQVNHGPTVFRFQSANVTKHISIDRQSGRPRIFDHLEANTSGRLVLYVAIVSATKLLFTFDFQTITCDTGEFVSVFALLAKQVNCTIQQKGANNKNSYHLSPESKLRDSPESKCAKLHFLSPQGHCVPFGVNCGSPKADCQLNISLKMFKLLQLTNRNATKQSAMTHVSTNNPPRARNLFRNLFTDCSREEIYKVTIGKGCAVQNEIQCTFGCQRCFPIHKLCVYELDCTGQLKHCPSGAHLKQCDEIECNNMLKCYQSYCVPYR